MYKILKRLHFIAKISENHCGNFVHAKKLIKCAKNNGEDAVKLQTYTADSMTIKSNKKYFQINEGLPKSYNLWDLYDEAYTPYKLIINKRSPFNFTKGGPITKRVLKSFKIK